MLDRASQDHKAIYTYKTERAWDNEKELYKALECMMRSKNNSMLNQVSDGQGYELLRLLSRRYDPQSPHGRQIYQAKIWALADDKCRSFNDVCARVELIERLCIQMEEATGKRPSKEILADALYPSLDGSPLTELETYHIT